MKSEKKAGNPSRIFFELVPGGSSGRRNFRKVRERMSELRLKEREMASVKILSAKLPTKTVSDLKR